MDDVISRQAAIRWVKTECNPYGNPTLDFESGKKIIEHLRQMPSTQPEQRWIPVSERLPEGDCECIVTVKTKHVDGYPDNEVCVADFYKGEFAPSQAWWGIERILAWMPLPAPYREVDT